MKNKFKRFLLEKKELLIFICVLALVFTTVITIASIAMKSSKDLSENSEPSVVSPIESSVDPVIVPTIPSESGDPADIEPIKIVSPVSGEYVIVRQFFDSELPTEELVKAVINTGTYLLESRGISYAMADNKTFNVNAIYPGRVLSITTDALEGSVITISHSDNMVSRYSSLATTSVEVGDVVLAGTTIGQAGTSILDNESGVHVHLEIMIDEAYINPTSAFGKNASEVVKSK